jgi:hypothetical protein
VQLSDSQVKEKYLKFLIVCMFLSVRVVDVDIWTVNIGCHIQIITLVTLTWFLVKMEYVLEMLI